MITCETFNHGVDFRWPDEGLSEDEWSKQYYRPALISISEKIKSKSNGRRVSYFLPNSDGAIKEIGDAIRFPGLSIPVFRLPWRDGEGKIISIGKIAVSGAFIHEYNT